MSCATSSSYGSATGCGDSGFEAQLGGLAQVTFPHARPCQPREPDGTDLEPIPMAGQTSCVSDPHLFRVIIPVTDIEAAASFYAQLLDTPGIRVSGGRHYFDCGGTILACYDALADGDAEQVGPNPQNVYFSVGDLNAAYERARAAGCQTLTAIEVRPWGERSFYGSDPFDNPICFVDSQTLFTGRPNAIG